MLRAYMQDSITVIFDNGENQWGEPLATTDTPMLSYIAWKSHLVRNLAGAQVLSRAIVYIICERTLTHKDKIRIGTVDYAILDLTPGKDFSENHQEAHIQ